MPEIDSLKVKDQLGRPEDKNITPKRFTEDITIESNTVIVAKDTIGNSWIVGSRLNGIVGANTATQNGQQQVVGGSGRTTTTACIANEANVFREHFRSATFKGASTTADWDTTNHWVLFDAGEVLVSGSVDFGNGVISTAIIEAEGIKGSLTYELTANGGTNWEGVTASQTHTFANTGTDLRYRITEAASGTAKLKAVTITKA